MCAWLDGWFEVVSISLGCRGGSISSWRDEVITAGTQGVCATMKSLMSYPYCGAVCMLMS